MAKVYDEGDGLIPHLARHWWALALRGLVAILFGVLAFAWPGLTVAVLVTLFGAYTLVDGIIALATAIRAAGREPRWWTLLIEGILDILAGLAAIFWPAITALVLLYLIAFWAIATGVFEILTAIRLRRQITNEWLLVLSGIASVLFGVLLLVLPGAGILTFGWLIGFYAILFGLLLIGLAFRLRSHANDQGLSGTA